VHRNLRAEGRQDAVLKLKRGNFQTFFSPTETQKPNLNSLLLLLSGRQLVVESSVPGRYELLNVQINKKDDKSSLFCWLKERGSTHR